MRPIVLDYLNMINKVLNRRYQPLEILDDSLRGSQPQTMTIIE